MLSTLPSVGFTVDPTVVNGVAPNQIVSHSLAYDENVVPCTASLFPLGVAQDGMYQAPGTFGADVTIAAPPGTEVQVYLTACVANVQCDGAITRGNYVISSANGFALQIVNNGGSPVAQKVLGIALQSAPGKGACINILIMPQIVSL